MAQFGTYRIFFKDKGPGEFRQGSELYSQTYAQFSPRALARRQKVLKDDSLISILDAPVYNGYVQTLQSLEATVLLRLRWKNYVVVETDSVRAEYFKTLSFVERVQHTRSQMTTLSLENTRRVFLKDAEFSSPVFALDCGQFGYGRSFNQAQMVNVPTLHSMGFTGKGTLTGFLDNGFRWKTHNALKNTDVVAEYDFIFQDSVTQNEFIDTPSQDNHGTPVLSTVAGFLKDSLVGIAPSASFLLGKTEDMRYERRIEEDNYAAGVEWMETLGADVISSSLGYLFFDEGDSYSSQDLTGNKTITAQAVNRAVALGVVCVTAGGNDGPGFGTIATPGDADSVITAAAVTPQGVAAGFSSRGPRSDGFIKPDIAAQGVSVVAVATGTENRYVNINGTSFSTPITAGNVTLLLSAFPELRPWEVRSALYSSGSQANIKDEILGYGIPDMVKAFKNAGLAISPIAYFPGESGRQLVFVHIVSDEKLQNSTLSVRFKDELSFQNFVLRATHRPYLYSTEIDNNLFKNSPADAFVTASNSSSSRRFPFKNEQYAVIHPLTTEIPCGVNPEVLMVPALNMPYPSLVTQTHDNIRFMVSLGDEESVDVKIYNIIGQHIYTAPNSVRIGHLAEITVPTNIFPVGAYIVHIQHGNSLHFTKFVITR
ncbi:MAG TPA: S8 family peptidase [Patescibacteria group bacterium]|nr:S8 family peptidase [Patescibacteria group bacterium]